MEENMIMKRFVIGCILSLILCSFSYAYGKSEGKMEAEAGMILLTDESDGRLSSWDILKLAIIRKESEYYPKVENNGYRGIYQLGSIYVEEVNRIVGKKMFKPEDAFDIEKSLKMFDIIQNAYNPEHDFDKAIRLHNPKAGKKYKNDVLRYFREISRQEDIRVKLLK